MPSPSDSRPPHIDPTRWGELVDSLDVATVFVVLSGWLGTEARSHLSVEDVWQETLWMAWRDRNQHEWVNLTRYRQWLLGIAKNRIQDMLRGLRRKKRGGTKHTAKFSEIGGSDTVGSMLPPRSTTPSWTASHLERARVFERALASLELPLREVVRLRLFEELGMEETATCLGIPLSTAKHRLVRGVQAYRARLEQLLGEGPATAMEAK
ncbi:MAG TPA: RNA polymerase sigma factor [Planctomycetota bacterium]